MTERTRLLIERLSRGDRLREAEYLELLTDRDAQSTALLREHADAVRRRYFGNTVFIRGLIEVSNICRNDCLYCGIRASNRDCARYRLDRETILACCKEGYALGFRTFVLQGGEDAAFTDPWLCDLLREIKRRHPDCAITLSLGERSEESYAMLREAGADRYLLRHETADAAHYASLHPSSMSFSNRMACLSALRTLGYQVGCGFMVGSPGQTAAHLAKDLAFIADFKPEMCGIGPFIPHHATPLGNQPAGDVDLTCYLLSILRLIHPPMLLPSTTALNTLAEDGRERGILSGGNVVMPNLSPPAQRKKYELYDHKKHSGAEAAAGLSELRSRMASIGYEIVTARGDFPKQPTSVF